MERPGNVTKLNPGVKLPDQNIAVVRRADGFRHLVRVHQRYLSKANARWKEIAPVLPLTGRPVWAVKRATASPPSFSVCWLYRLRRIRLRQANNWLTPKHPRR
ncbi:hypothetical protein M8494_32500 [Serratia ureilytica]